MKPNQLFRLSRRVMAMMIPLAVSGCAAYYSHYAVFPAENSQREARQVKLTWQTAEYPDWWIADNKSTPITIETQCSTRKWRLVDDSHEEAGQADCADGIRACGVKGKDVLVGSGEPAGPGTRCMAINPGSPDPRITDIESSLNLLVSCEPVKTVRGSGDDSENIDYIRASSVPYIVYSRKSPRGSLIARPPELDDAVCEDDG
ncbi:hypothetical protein QPM17_18500 [Marinobacter sp. TBZ242]|uniref:Uncharacterized protein n=1 Tax=Marinobacter azerbaijanicus TaxID=3050455 RepID=A0ABT7IG74_9GAMM|nr:hypothetical protein [Marinobacter sp. TBZ242]MDL0433135.1 hypothetical protein [Marinobacter sp. TBZ242]